MQLAVHDAGAGYASLRHVLGMHPHSSEPDRSWVVTIEAALVRQPLVRGMIDFAASFNSMIGAEGKEAEVEARTFAALGVELAQGYLLGRPTPLPSDMAGRPGRAVPGHRITT